MRVTDEQLRRLVASDPSNPDLLRELQSRVRWNVLRAAPAPRGTWRGRPVVLDCKGAYSSGYWGFVGSSGYPPIDTWDEIVVTPDPRRERLIALARSLRP